VLRPQRGAEYLIVRLGRRFWRTAVRLPGLTARALYHGFLGLYNSDDLTFASSIAYYALMSLFPLLLLMLSVLGMVTNSEDERASLLNFVFEYFPRQFDFITRQLDAFRLRSGALGLGGSLLLIWASLGFFSALTTAVNHAWGVEKQFSYLKNKLVSFLMLVAAGVLMLAGILLLSAKGIVGASWFAAVLAQAPGLHILTSFVVEWATTLIFIMVVGLIFYFVPNAKVRFKDVWVGAVVTGLLWRLAFLAFSWWLRDGNRLSIHGAAAAVIAFLIWVYTCSVIMLYGVEFTVSYARLRRLIEDDETPPVEAASVPD
jgi:membrane protein